MIVVARLDRAASLPAATHVQIPSGGLFEPKPKWIGWLSAIEDLVETLPDTKLARWQLERLPSDWATMLVGASGYEGYRIHRPADEPAFTLTATHGRQALRAVLIGEGLKADARTANRPSLTITGNSSRMKALLVPDSSSSTLPLRSESQPAPTIHNANRSGNIPRAIMAGREPRVVRLTQRALARLQSFPDWYQLLERMGLACKGLGNAVPPLLTRSIGLKLKK